MKIVMLFARYKHSHCRSYREDRVTSYNHCGHLMQFQMKLCCQSSTSEYTKCCHHCTAKTYYARTMQTWWTVCFHYRPQRSCGQGNIFTPVWCLEYCVSAPREQTPPTPLPGANPPWDQTAPEKTPPPRPDPPGSRHPHHPGSKPPPLGPDNPPGTRHPPGATPLGADTPRPDTPPGKQTPAYGLRAAGTHPTGMYSCF